MVTVNAKGGTSQTLIHVEIITTNSSIVFKIPSIYVIRNFKGCNVSELVVFVKIHQTIKTTSSWYSKQ